MFINKYEYSREVIEAFTEGDCWALALSVNKLTNWPLIFITEGAEAEDWLHVLVKMPNGKWLDIHGANTPKQVRKYWKSENWAEVGNRVTAELLIESADLRGRWYTDYHPDKYAIDLLNRLGVECEHTDLHRIM